MSDHLLCLWRSFIATAHRRRGWRSFKPRCFILKENVLVYFSSELAAEVQHSCSAGACLAALGVVRSRASSYSMTARLRRREATHASPSRCMHMQELHFHHTHTHTHTHPRAHTTHDTQHTHARTHTRNTTQHNITHTRARASAHTHHHLRVHTLCCRAFLSFACTLARAASKLLRRTGHSADPAAGHARRDQTNERGLQHARRVRTWELLVHVACTVWTWQGSPTWTKRPRRK